jgi:hypothetical protein
MMSRLAIRSVAGVGVVSVGRFHWNKRTSTSNFLNSHCDGSEYQSSPYESRSLRDGWRTTDYDTQVSRKCHFFFVME